MRLGIDLGGTKIELVALDDTGDECWRRRVATPHDDYPGVLDAIVGLVRDAESDLGATGSLGLGIPGSLSPRDGRVRNGNSTWLNGEPLKEDLEARLARPVRIENDANCMTVSEASDGAARGARVVFGVILGTGVGGGIAIDGRAWRGRNAVAGEWGHNPLPWPQAAEVPGPRCWCGKHGCIETWLSGPALAADHARGGGEPVDSRQVIARMRAGDALAVAAFDRYVERLGRALAHAVDLLDPDAIVLAGGMSNVDELYARVPPRLAEWVFSDVMDTPVVKAVHGDSSGVRGAAWLWP